MASQLSFTVFAWKNLWRRRLRTLLLWAEELGIAGLAVGLIPAWRSGHPSPVEAHRHD